MPGQQGSYSIEASLRRVKEIILASAQSSSMVGTITEQLLEQEIIRIWHLRLYIKYIFFSAPH
jgi:Mn2+/Fe2+ NRAMP family transporter